MFTEKTLSHLCSALYSTVSIATGHDWWERTPEECKPIAEPLAQWVATLPPDVAEKLTTNAGPIAILGGIVTVSAPAISQEINLARARKNPEQFAHETALLAGDNSGSEPQAIDSPGDQTGVRQFAAPVSTNGKSAPGVRSGAGGIRLGYRAA
jgi:hypothetical protein